MSKQDDETQSSTPRVAENKLRDIGNATTREDETGDVAEANAPTGIHENAGMNTILGGGLGTGVQTDDSDG